MIVIDTLSSLIEENPYLSFGIGIFLTIVVIVLLVKLIKWLLPEYIRCKVIENGRYRYTDVIHSKRKNTYKVHRKSGGWVKLDEKNIKIIIDIRLKFAKRLKYNKHVTPEFTLD